MINSCKRLANTREGRLVGDQLFKAGTSVGANYRAACRARSKADFIAKLGSVLEEADESLYWVELLDETNVIKGPFLTPLMREADELLAIFVTSLNTAKARD